MFSYKILGEPRTRRNHPTYRGLYRSEPYYGDAIPYPEILPLVESYIHHLSSKNMGVTNELNFAQLSALTKWSQQVVNPAYELVFLSDEPFCPYTPKEYLGIDVTGLGGYSLLGERFFIESKDHPKSALNHVINHYFKNRLNENYLFRDIETAEWFKLLLEEFMALDPGRVEPEDWRAVYLFRIILA